MDDYLGHLREFRRILTNLETQTTHRVSRETLAALSQKLARDESQLNADRLERSIRATVEATRTLEDLDHYQQDVMAVFQEITTRKRTELERERFRKLLDQTGESILVVEPHTGRFVDVNQTAARELGYTKEELLELSLNHIEVGLPLTPSASWHDWVASIRNANEVLCLEGMHRRKDGSRFQVEASVGLAHVDNQELLLVISRDITERKRTENRLRRQWAFFSRLAHRSVDGIMAFDRGFNVTYWNPAMERILGERKSKVLGKNVFQILPQLKELGEDRYFRDALAGTTSTSRNRPYRHGESGRQVFFDGYYFALAEESGEILGGIGIVRDVSERRETQLRQAREAMTRMDQQRLEQLEVQRRLETEIAGLKQENEQLLDASSRALDHSVHTERVEGLEVLASGVAREVEPLMNGILSQTGLALAELPPDSPLRRGVEEIEEAALSATSLATTLQSFSGNASTNGHQVQIDELLSELEHSIRALLYSRTRLDLPNLSSPSSLPLVRGDAHQLRELVLALTANAAESVGEEAGRLHLATGVVDVDATELSQAYLGRGHAPGRYVYLEVSDSGAGMDEETCSKIFVPFFSTKEGHRGLGLATVMGVLRAHNGMILVESEPHGGSTFRVLFPAPPENGRPG